METRLKYNISTNEEESFIEEEEVKYVSLGKTPRGNTAYCRFFGIEKLPKFVVKQPKPNYWRGDLELLKREDLITEYKSKYEDEFEKWNRIHPENKATLITNGGLRLVLPHLGTRLSWWLAGFDSNIVEKEEQLEYCQITLGVFLEVKRLHDLGLFHGDFNKDNIVLKRNADSSFRAYIIDVECVSHHQNNLEWTILDSLLINCDIEKYYANCESDSIPYKQGSSNYRLQLNILSLKAKIADLKNPELIQESSKLKL